MERIGNNTVILGVAAHPDDLDFSASGTIAKWIKDGAKVYYLICTDGRKGSDDPKMTEEKLIKIRRREQIDAGKILGLKNVFFLKHRDTELVADIKLKREIASYIRRLKPDIVVTLDPTYVYSGERGMINHTDHRAVGEAALDAIYPLSRDRLTFRELSLAPHKVKTVYLTCFDNPMDIVDISETFSLKIKCLNAHVSQISDNTIKRITKWARALGKKKGYRYAEGFIRITLPD
jgi:LmbE family N-acetylglucosaminyl deacetylase